jgi:two-component system response regulator PilR (NtrC family)
MRPVVLVVEDEPDLVVTYERALGRQGCSVTAAGTVRDALTALDSARFALVIVDLRLPDGSGLEIVHSAHRRADGPPVIVVTGFSSPQSRREALAAGATAYMTKPFSIGALTALVQTVLVPPPS